MNAIAGAAGTSSRSLRGQFQAVQREVDQRLGQVPLRWRGGDSDGDADGEGATVGHGGNGVDPGAADGSTDGGSTDGTTPLASGVGNRKHDGSGA